MNTSKYRKNAFRKSQLFSISFLGIVLLSFGLIVSSLFLSSSQDTRGRAAELTSAEVIARDIQSTGTSRVIVQFASSQTVPSALTTTSEKIFVDRNKTDTFRVTQALAGTNYAVRQEFRYVPMVAMEVHADSLQKLTQLQAQGVVTQIFPDNKQLPDLFQSRGIIGANIAESGTYPSLPRGKTGPRADGTGVVVAVVDNGVDKTHPFLSGKIVAEVCTLDCPNGTNFQTGEGAAKIGRGDTHGTLVSGVVAGNATTMPIIPGNQKVRNIAGVATGAKIAAIRFTHPNQGWGDDSSAIRAFEWVYENRNNYNFAAINYSYSSERAYSYCPDNPYSPIVKLLAAANIAVAKSAGNTAAANGVGMPGCVQEMIPVAATMKDDKTIASYSSTSFFHENFIAAPGDGIWTATPYAPKWAAVSGTSFAAPHVAGAIAILKQAFPTVPVLGYVEAFQKTGKPFNGIRTGVRNLTVPRIQIDQALLYLQERSTYCWNKATNNQGTLSWRSSCRGAAGGDSCLQVITPLTKYEAYEYNSWVSRGKPAIPGCN